MRWTLNSPSKFIKEEDFSSPVDDEELIMFEDIEEVDVSLKNKWESKFCYDYVLNLIDYLMTEDLKWQVLGSND